MKIISFVSPNFRQGPKELNAYYLPYSLGILWSYVSQFKIITDNYCLGEIIWRRDSIPNVVNLLKNSDIVCFSTYVWNRNYNTTLARELKKFNPEIKIIFGGPELPIENQNFFYEFPYINVHVKQEGEFTFKKYLSNIL